MKTYAYEGKEYVESGEVRVPQVGEWFLSIGGRTVIQSDRDDHAPKKILIPKEQKVSEVQDEFQIPVLVKAKAQDSVWVGELRALAGKVVMARATDGGYDAKGIRNEAAGCELFLPSQVAVAYPTSTEVLAEQAKLAPKPDTLPAPVRAALDADNRQVCGGARKYVRDLVEAIYQNPPRAERNA